jgi:hypothetical protein
MTKRKCHYLWQGEEEGEDRDREDRPAIGAKWPEWKKYEHTSVRLEKMLFWQ